ncbi:MAG: [protein-PII] uridylyltransferase [Alphaproteobacteria bacterium]|nr:MAG: [protein-PII] uridylyltransferase [Alphaproteobacteria bacterium]
MDAATDLTLTLPDGEHLRESLTEIGKDPELKDFGRRKEVLTILKKVQEEGRASARTALEAGLGGIEVATYLSDLQDLIIQILYDYTTSFAYRASTEVKGEKLGLVAIGGYGRGLLAPGSDVDILFLMPYKQTPWGESVVEYMLYMLWDLGLKVGHATRTLDDCIKLSLSDMTIRTSLLEMRYIWGDQELFDTLIDRYDKEVVASAPVIEFIDAKLDERNKRHARAGESRYLVEPNLKEGKGGLRDLHTLYWIGKYAYRVTRPEELVDKGLFSKSEYRQFRLAEAFYWTVRCHLHFMTGRAEERLSFEHQMEMAERMKVKSHGGLSAVERFMTRYFRTAKEVGILTRIFCAALELEEKKPAPFVDRLLPFRASRRKLGTGGIFQVEHGRISHAAQKPFRSDPVNILRLFQLAGEHQLDIHPTTLKKVTRQRALIDEALRANEDANRIFMEILKSTEDTERVLRLMNESGVLGAFMPDFGKIEAMMQFNMYHHYTVDEHTIRALGILARIERGELSDEHPLASRIIHHVKSRDVLYMAIFLHDIAKGRDGDHSILGAEIAREVGPRFGFSSSDTETIAWLVEYHLLFSEYAQTRDISDPMTVDNFVSIVQTPERLRLLLILTVADIRAVGPGVWNGWKGELLRQLYEEAEQRISGGLGSQPRERQIQNAKLQLRENLADWPEEEWQAYLDRHEAPYWLGLDSNTHRRHAEALRQADAEGLAEGAVLVQAVPDQFRDVTQVSIYTPDQVGLFAKLTGALKVTGASIADAKVFTTKDGMALDVFWVQGTHGGPISNPDNLKRLKANIEKVLAGKLDPATAMPRPLSRRREEAFSVEPEVLLDNGASNICTVIEVSGLDRPGLLFDVANAIVGLGLSVSSAHVATFGERMVGVIYVKDVYGYKITHEVKLRKIRTALTEAVEGSSKPQQAAE